MINWKILILAAGIGFILSFITGLVFGADFGFLLLRALICAGIFGVVGGAVQFVYVKFLGGSARTETAGNSGEGASLVDISIDDEYLQPEKDVTTFDIEDMESISPEDQETEGQEKAPGAPPEAQDAVVPPGDSISFPRFQPVSFNAPVVTEADLPEEDVLSKNDNLRSKVQGKPLSAYSLDPETMAQTVRTMLAGE
jgi:hypothetical protein